MENKKKKVETWRPEDVSKYISLRFKDRINKMEIVAIFRDNC